MPLLHVSLRKQDVNVSLLSFPSVIYTAHAFGMFPVLIDSRLDVESVHFKWFSLPMMVLLFITSTASFQFGLAMYNLVQTQISFKTTGAILFYTVAILAIFSYYVLARRWPKFIRNWRKVESPFLEKIYHTPESLRMSKDISFLGFGILFCAFGQYFQLVFLAEKFKKTILVEHVSSIGAWLYTNHQLMSICNVTNMSLAEYHFRRHRSDVFTIGIPFTYYIVPLLQWITLSLTFSWSFIDISIIAISRCLACRLRQIHYRIENMAGTVSCLFFF